MAADSPHMGIANRIIERLRESADVTAIVVEIKEILGDRRELLDPLLDELVGLIALEDETQQDSFVELVANAYLTMIRLGATYDWGRGIVHGAQGLSHLLIDVARQPERALAELAAIDSDLFDANPSAWAGIKGDMGIAMLWLKRPKDALLFLAIPCALENVLMSPEAVARYRGNMGMALALEGLFDQARVCLRRAIEATVAPDLINKFTADLRQIEEAMK